MNKKSNWLSDKDYNFIYSRVPRLTIDLVIKNKDGVLMTLRDIEPSKGMWHLPGGRLFFDESVADVVERVAREELGLKVTQKDFLGFVEFPEEKQESGMRHSVSLVFLVEPKNGARIRGSWQAKEIGYFNSKNKPKNMHKEHEVFLKKLKLM